MVLVKCDGPFLVFRLLEGPSCVTALQVFEYKELIYGSFFCVYTQYSY